LDNDISWITDREAHLRTFDVGVAPEFEHGRWLVQPWIGAHIMTGTVATTYTELDPNSPPPAAKKQSVDLQVVLATGVLVAVDVTPTRWRDRLSLCTEVQLSNSSHTWPDASYDAFTFGIAYHR
jgi:hypothetical protein